MKPNQHPQYVSTQDLAQHLGISAVAVWKRIQAGRIEAVKMGRSYAIPKTYIRKHFPDFPLEERDREYISLMQAAQLLGVSRETIRKKVKAGQLDAYKVGRHFVVAKDQILAQPPRVPRIPTDIVEENLSIPQVAQYLGVSRIAVFKQVQKGVIAATKVGRHYSIRAKDLLGTSHQGTDSASKEYLSVAEVARQKGISRFSIVKQIQKGKIQAIKIGRSYAILKTDMDREETKNK